MMMRLTFLLSVAFVALEFSHGFMAHSGPRPVVTKLDSTAAPSLDLKAKYAALKPALPADMSAVKCGGYYNLQKLSANPKEELVNLIVAGLKESETIVKVPVDSEKVEALATLLYAKGKGFDADLVDGDWVAVLSRQGKKSPKFQKLVGRRASKGLSINTFDISSMTFEGDVKVLKKGLVYSQVKYDPITEGYSKTVDGKIVLRRIACDIVKATFKFWKLPTLSLPFLRKKGGYLEFVYLDEDIRVTRGNRGGLFVHFRPEFLASKIEK